MKITVDTANPTDVKVTEGNRKTAYAAVTYEVQCEVCKALEAARLQCSMTLKSEPVK